MWKLASENPNSPSTKVLEKASQIQGPIQISVRHFNRLRLEWGLNRTKGRPVGTKKEKDSGSKGELVKEEANLPFVGVHIFDAWMEDQEMFTSVLTLLKQGILSWSMEHPNRTFPLLSHKDETLLLRFKALFYAPLLGIEKLTEFDVKEHGLKTLIGRGYQSSTLTQFLGQLELINGGNILLPALLPSNPGIMCYIDGHMIPFWTKKSMHKGKITMLGRIMSGSQAVVAHDENGHALFVEYYPPDIRLPRMIIEYCQKIVESTSIEMFIIDREINSVAMAIEFESNNLGLLSMLDKNEYKDLSDWDVEFTGKIADGSNVYFGTWKIARKNDPRQFVIVEKEGRLLPFWGTSKVKEILDPLDWPKVYTDRTEIQENSFKHMKDHGAMDINYGIKKIEGPDRHQGRAKEKLEDRLSTVQERVTKQEEKVREQEAKVKESEERSHKERLIQRQNNLVLFQADVKKTQKKEGEIKSKIDNLGPEKQREDRDFRKQLIMTFRTLLLENMLRIFCAVLLGKAGVKMGVDSLIDMLFKRSGSYIETYSKIVYQINMEGLSTSYNEKLRGIVDGLNAMNLHKSGKPIQVKIRSASP